jgi:acetyl esterase
MGSDESQRGHSADIDKAREDMRARAAMRPAGPAVASVRDLALDGLLPARLYRPSPDPMPLTIFFHGGGFVLGDLDTHDAVCRRLAQTSLVSVLSVDYRRAPEHPGPAAVDDGVRAGVWALDHLAELGGDRTTGIGLAGDSAGGAIAVLTGVRLRALGLNVGAMLLLYPNADMTLSMPSVQEKGHGWGLDVDDLTWFVQQWVPDPERRAAADVSPVHAPLHGLPPTLLVTAEHDPLRDEGVALANAMRAAGGDVVHVDYSGLRHGFVGSVHDSRAAAQATTDSFDQFGWLVRRAAGRPT